MPFYITQNFPSTPIRIQLPGVTLTVPSSIVASQLVNSHSLISSQISQDSTISESSGASTQEENAQDSTGISFVKSTSRLWVKISKRGIGIAEKTYKTRRDH